MKWKDISLNREIISVRKTIQRISSIGKTQAEKTEMLIDSSKSKSSVRDIPIPHFLINGLKNLYKGNDNAYFLTGSENYIEPRTYQNRFRSYIRDSSIEGVNFHALRHTFATRCAESGFDFKSLSEILGHANVNITLNRYVHSSLEQKQINMQKLHMANKYALPSIV